MSTITSLNLNASKYSVYTLYHYTYMIHVYFIVRSSVGYHLLVGFGWWQHRDKCPGIKQHRCPNYQIGEHLETLQDTFNAFIRRYLYISEFLIVLWAYTDPSTNHGEAKPLDSLDSWCNSLQRCTNLAALATFLRTGEDCLVVEQAIRIQIQATCCRFRQSKKRESIRYVINKL